MTKTTKTSKTVKTTKKARTPKAEPFDKEKAIAVLKKSRAYEIAYKDDWFINSSYARPARLQLELLKTEIGMRYHRIRSTIVAFGGTRILEPSEAHKQLRKAERMLKSKPNDPERKRAVRIARSLDEKSVFYEEARKFARLVSSDRYRRRTGHHGGGQPRRP